MPGNIELAGPIPLTAVPQLPLPRFEINWDDNPTLEFPPTGYTDVSNRLRGFATRRGRSNWVDRVEAGTATVVLDNRDGYFNPGTAGRLLMRKARLQAYYNNEYKPLITGFIESYRFSYPGTDKDAIVELTISDGLKVLALQQYTSSYQRENEAPQARLVDALLAAGIGTSYHSFVGTISTNELAPIRVTEPAIPTTQLRSATRTNLSASITVASTAGLVVGMSVTGPGVPADTFIQSIDSSTALTLTKLVYLSRSKTCVGEPWVNLTVLSGISDTSDLSVGMLVDPNGTVLDTNSNRIFPVGCTITDVRATEVTTTPWNNGTWGAPGANTRTVPFTANATENMTFPRTYLPVSGILDHIRQIEATERGLFVPLPDGRYEYQGNGYRPSQTAILTFGEQSGEVPYQEVPLVYDDTAVRNEYALKNLYHDSVTLVIDATSQARYYRRHEDIEQVWYANATLLPTEQRIFEPLPRLEGLRVAPASDPLTLWPQLLNLEVSKRVNVKRRPNGGSDILSAYSQYVEGIQHDGAPGDWRVTFITSPVR